MGKLQLEPKRSSRFPKLHHHSSFAHPGESSLERPEWKTTPTQIDTSKFRFKTKKVKKVFGNHSKQQCEESELSLLYEIKEFEYLRQKPKLQL